MDLYRFFDAHGITYERHDHPPVNTVEEAKRLVPPLPGARIKNLFLCDPKGRRHFLVVVEFDKRVDLKSLAPLLGVSRLRFGSPARLENFLGVAPGAVSVLAILNDPQGRVELVMDKEIWHAQAFQCHPLVNTTTLVLSRDDLRRVIAISGHRPRVLAVPAGAGEAGIRGHAPRSADR